MVCLRRACYVKREVAEVLYPAIKELEFHYLPFVIVEQIKPKRQIIRRLYRVRIVVFDHWIQRTVDMRQPCVKARVIDPFFVDDVFNRQHLAVRIYYFGRNFLRIAFIADCRAGYFHLRQRKPRDVQVQPIIRRTENILYRKVQVPAVSGCVIKVETVYIGRQRFIRITRIGLNLPRNRAKARLEIRLCYYVISHYRVLSVFQGTRAASAHAL